MFSRLPILLLLLPLITARHIIPLQRSSINLNKPLSHRHDPSEPSQPLALDRDNSFDYQDINLTPPQIQDAPILIGASDASTAADSNTSSPDDQSSTSLVSSSTSLVDLLDGLTEASDNDETSSTGELRLTEASVDDEFPRVVPVTNVTISIVNETFTPYGKRDHDSDSSVKQIIESVVNSTGDGVDLFVNKTENFVNDAIDQVQNVFNSTLNGFEDASQDISNQTFSSSGISDVRNSTLDQTIDNLLAQEEKELEKEFENEMKQESNENGEFGQNYQRGTDDQLPTSENDAASTGLVETSTASDGSNGRQNDENQEEYISNTSTAETRNATAIGEMMNALASPVPSESNATEQPTSAASFVGKLSSPIYWVPIAVLVIALSVCLVLWLKKRYDEKMIREKGYDLQDVAMTEVPRGRWGAVYEDEV